jgi:hypothetical protein
VAGVATITTLEERLQPRLARTTDEPEG